MERQWANELSKKTESRQARTNLEGVQGRSDGFLGQKYEVEGGRSQLSSHDRAGGGRGSLVQLIKPQSSKIECDSSL